MNGMNYTDILRLVGGPRDTDNDAVKLAIFNLQSGGTASTGEYHLGGKPAAKKTASERIIVKLALGEEMARRLMHAEHRYFRPGGPKTGPNATNIVKALGIGAVTDPASRHAHLDKALVRTFRKAHESKSPDRRQLYSALNHAIGAKNEVMSLNKAQIYKKLTGKDPSLMDKLLGSY
jgi:hypothetical protein